MSDTSPEGSALSRDTRKWGMFCHLSALVGLLGNGIGFLLGPLILWLIKKEDHPFIDDQGKAAVNFQLTMFLVLVIGAVLSLVGIGILILIAAALVMTIFPIIGAIKANEGESYRYPFSISFIK